MKIKNNKTTKNGMCDIGSDASSTLEHLHGINPKLGKMI